MSVGLNAKIYRNTGTPAAPVWTDCPEFENVSFSPSYDRAESNSRESPFGRIKLGLSNVSVSARLKTKPGNTNYEALMDAFMLGTALDLLVLDGAETVVGSRGIRAAFHLVESPQDQSLSTRLYNGLTLVPADEDDANLVPRWAKVAAGPAIVYASPGGAFA